MPDITKQDIKWMSSQRLDDTDQGGGQMTAVEILDGDVNNLFPDISRLDRTYGRVSMRKAYLSIRTLDRATYYGSHTVLTEQAADPLVSVSFFTTEDWFDTRDEAQARIEAYLVKGPGLNCALYSNHYQGAKALKVIHHPTFVPPEIGDVLVLVTDVDLNGASINEVEQYVRITNVDTTTEGFTNANGDAYEKGVTDLTLGSSLEMDLKGSDASQSSDYSNVSTQIYTTVAADTSKYYGVTTLATPVEADSFALKVHDIKTSVVPSAQSQTPILDAGAGNRVSPIIQTASTTPDISVNMYHSSSIAGTVTELGAAIVMGTLNIGGGTYTDNSKGEIVNSSAVIVGTISYETGQINWNGVAGGAGTYTTNFTLACAPQRYSKTGGIYVDINNRGFVYVYQCTPPPLPNSLKVEYRAGEKWYTMWDHGDGEIKGQDISIGSGTLIYESGSLSLTLGEMPDVGSDIMIYWAESVEFNSIAGTTSYLSYDFFLQNQGIVPNTLNIEFTQDTTDYTWTDDGNGNVLFDGVTQIGRIQYATGRVILNEKYGLNHSPAALTNFRIRYSYGTPEEEEFFAPPRDYIAPGDNKATDQAKIFATDQQKPVSRAVNGTNTDHATDAFQAAGGYDKKYIMYDMGAGSDPIVHMKIAVSDAGPRLRGYALAGSNDATTATDGTWTTLFTSEKLFAESDWIDFGIRHEDFTNGDSYAKYRLDLTAFVKKFDPVNYVVTDAEAPQASPVTGDRVLFLTTSAVADAGWGAQTNWAKNIIKYNGSSWELEESRDTTLLNFVWDNEVGEWWMLDSAVTSDWAQTDDQQCAFYVGNFELWDGGNAGIKLNLNNTDAIVPHTFEIEWHTLIEELSTRTRIVWSAVDPTHIYNDDGNGNFKDEDPTHGGISTAFPGMVNYDVNGHVAFAPDFIGKTPHPVYDWIDVGPQFEDEAGTPTVEQVRIVQDVLYLDSPDIFPTDGTVTVRYHTFNGANTSDYNTTLDKKIVIDPGYLSQIVPGSLFLKFPTSGANEHVFDKEGNVYFDNDISDGFGTDTLIGTINYETKEITVTQDFAANWDNMSQNIQVDVFSGETYSGASSVSNMKFRTPGSPITPGSFTIKATASDGTQLTGTANFDGEIVGDGLFGSIRYDTGSVNVYYGEYVTDDAAAQAEDWYNAANVVGSTVYKPYFVDASTVSMNCVVESYLPLDSDLLGLDPVRLPLDGKVPMFRDGDIILIHHSNQTACPDPPTAGGTVNASRTNVDLLEVYDSTGVFVQELGNYTVDLVNGLITWENPLDLSAYTGPFVLLDRIEDMVLVSDVQITGHMSTATQITHQYPADTTMVSTVLPSKDLQARVYNEFTQETWNGNWQDTREGSATVSNYDLVNYPIQVTNQNSIRERWACIFTSSTAFNVVGEHLGIIATGSIPPAGSNDVAPLNPSTGSPYFTMDKDGWGTGWSAGDVFRFNTDAANFPLWFLRTTLQGPATTNEDYHLRKQSLLCTNEQAKQCLDFRR